MPPRGTAVLLVLGRLLPFTAGLQLESRGTSEPSSRADSSMLCFAVVTATEDTLDPFVKQLSGCSRRLLFSDFEDSEREIVKLFDKMHDNRVNGWLNITRKLAKAWDYIASNVEHPYDWYVKLDADTFFRPRKLSLLTSHMDPEQIQALGISHAVVDGAMEVLSKGAFNSLKPFFKDPMSAFDGISDKSLCWFEDKWLSTSLWRVKQNAVKTNDDIVDERKLALKNESNLISWPHYCEELLVSYFNRKKFDEFCRRKTSDKKNGPCAGARTSRDEFLWGTLFDGSDQPRADVFTNVFQHGAVDEKGHWCISADVVGIHPVKSRSKYEALQAADSM